VAGWKRWAVALIVFGAGALAIIWALGSPQGLDSATKVGALITGLTPLILGLIYWARRSPHALPVMSTPEQVSAAARQLANLVLAQWRTEIVVRHLDDPAPLAMRWRLTEFDTTGHADHLSRPKLLRYLIGQGTPRFEGRTDRISDLATEFLKLPCRRLVILGDPGMGKTTLAVLLLRELLIHRRGDEPVPVLLSMSGWDPGTESLHMWVARRLADGYPALRAADFGPDASRCLVDQRRILPVLDGLDELPERVRPAILDQLNAAAADPLILTCRTAEYETALADQGRRGLTSAAVIEPNQLQAADAAAYLERNLPHRIASGWVQLLSALKADQTHPVSQALSSPLTLWLVRKVYVETRADPAELCDTSRFATADALIEHLLDHLVDALITANPPRRGTDDEHPFSPRHAWQPSDAKNWLAFLAHHMHGLGSRDLAWWQLSLAVARPIKPVVGLVGGLTVGLVGGLVGALVGGLVGGLDGFVAGLVFGLGGGLVFGLGGGLVGGLLSGASVREPVYADLRLHGRIRLLARQMMAWSSIRAGLIGGLVAGLVSGLANGFTGGPEGGPEAGFATGLAAGLVDGLTVALVFGLVFGLAEWAKTPLTNERPQTPIVTFHRDLQLAYFYSLVCGLVVGSVIGLGFGFGAGPEGGLVGALAVGLVAALVVGLAVGLAAGLRQSSGQHLVTVAVLRAQHRVPLRLLTFLDDAHRLGLLRAAGPVYQFRHAKLQDRLARTYTTRA
jgi:NACHT domain-containing protein